MSRFNVSNRSSNSPYRLQKLATKLKAEQAKCERMSERIKQLEQDNLEQPSHKNSNTANVEFHARNNTENGGSQAQQSQRQQDEALQELQHIKRVLDQWEAAAGGDGSAVDGSAVQVRSSMLSQSWQGDYSALTPSEIRAIEQCSTDCAHFLPAV